MQNVNTRRHIRGLLGAALLVCAHWAGAAVEVGQPAPDFVLSGSDGQVHRLADMRGHYVVVAFFPKAFTSG